MEEAILILGYILGAMNALVTLGMTAQAAYICICSMLDIDDDYDDDNDKDDIGII